MSGIEKNEQRAKQLLEKLQQYPELQERFERIVSIIENEDGTALTFDEAEERAFEEVRKLGQELLQNWAHHKQEKVVKEYNQRSNVRRKGKKNCAG